MLKSGVSRDEKEIIVEATTMVRETIGPVAAFKELLIVPKLPKTRSGKILRKILRSIINKEEYKFPSTIEDASVLDNIKELFKPKKNMDTKKASPFMGWLIEKEVEEKCTLQEIAELPAEGVTIEVAFSTVNYKDALALQSKAPIARKFPMVPGIDLAGKVVSEGNTLFPKGTEVFSNGWGVGENHWGGLAQMACLPEAYLQKIPDALTAKDCMALGTAGYTAMLCVLALLDSGVKPEDGKVAISAVNYKDSCGVGTVLQTTIFMPGRSCGKSCSEGNTCFPRRHRRAKAGVLENITGESKWLVMPEAYEKIPDALRAKDCMALGTAGYTAMLCVLANLLLQSNHR